VSKFKKGDLIRCRWRNDKGIVLDVRVPDGSMKVLWLIGNCEGECTLANPDYLVKLEESGG